MQYITGFCRGFWAYLTDREGLTLNPNRGWRHGRAVAYYISGGY